MKPRSILIAAGAVFVLFGYPGFMRGDAIDELFDSRTGAITDWHSPMFTEVWRVLGRVLSGPAPLFLLQGGMLLLGAYSLVRRITTDRVAAYTAAAILLFPPLIASTAIVSEAGTLAGFLICGAALLFSGRRVAGLVLLVVACGLQEGAAIAALPIVIAGLQWPVGRWRRLGAATVAWIAIAGLGLGINRLLIEDRSYRREVALAMLDIVGTLDHADPIDDAHARSALPKVELAVTTKLQQRAKAAHSHPNALDHGDTRFFEPVTYEDESLAVIAASRGLSRSMPLAYLRHRIHELSHVLGISRLKSWQPMFTEFVQNKGTRLVIAHEAHHSVVQRCLIWPVKQLSRTLLFRPFIYFFLGLVLIPIAFVRGHGLAAMLLVSGVVHELALGIVAFAPRYTDSHWLIVTTVLAAILIVLETRNKRVLEQAPLRVAQDQGV